MEFLNKNILITGAADGLGFAVSKIFADKKANLFLVDINYEKLVKNNLPNSKIFKCDLSKIDLVKELIDNLSDKKIDIDVLIHNAAVLIPKSFEDTDLKYWNEMINISLNSGFILSNYAWKNMKKKK